MNTYKLNREEFIGKYFISYHETLVRAIRASDPDYYSIEPSTVLSEVNSIQDLTRSKIVEKLNSITRTDIHHKWEYYYPKANAIISDWACMQWDKEKGLYIHFEWIDISSSSDNSIQMEVEMDEKGWEFFFGKRNIIFDNFFHEFSEPPEKHEDFILYLTDEELTPLPIYKVV